MSRDLALGLFDCGIMQFGRFASPSGAAPIRFDPLMLPSYPAVVRVFAEACAQRIQMADGDRLCCTLNTLPLGIVVGQMTNQPILYTPSLEHEPLRTFIGAYDIGHPALVLWSWSLSEMGAAWAEQMRQVGLVLERRLVLVGDEDSVLPLTVLLEHLVAAKRILPVQADTCLHWYERVRLHQG
jgi:hypothetical protein